MDTNRHESENRAAECLARSIRSIQPPMDTDKHGYRRRKSGGRRCFFALRLSRCVRRTGFYLRRSENPCPSVSISGSTDWFSVQ